MDPQLLSNASRLKDIYTTILLVYQRNKNQHGNSKWWKWLSLLKRSTLKLIDDIEELGSNIDIDGESCIKARATHIRTHIVPRCYMYGDAIHHSHSWETNDIPEHSRLSQRINNFRPLVSFWLLF